MRKLRLSIIKNIKNGQEARRVAEVLTCAAVRGTDVTLAPRHGNLRHRRIRLRRVRQPFLFVKALGAKFGVYATNAENRFGFIENGRKPIELWSL